MSKTKIFLGEKTIFASKESSFNGTDYYEYACTDGSTFNSIKKYEVNDVICVYITKFNNQLSLFYSRKGE